MKCVEFLNDLEYWYMRMYIDDWMACVHLR